MPKIYNCPIGNDFLSHITKLIYGDDLAGLNDPNNADKTIVYVPTARIAKGLQDNIVKANNYNPIIMPQIKVLGSGTDEMDFLAFDDLGFKAGEPVNKTTREFWLADTIKQFYKGLNGDDISMEIALSGAKSVATVFDNLHLYETDLSDIDELVAELDLSKHWEINKAFISHIKPAWESELDRRGRADIGAYKVATLNAICDYITNSDKQIILAGVNPNYPALTRVMQAVASHKHGTVVINGYDNNLTDTQKQNIATDPTHPLSHLQQFIDDNNINVIDLTPTKPNRADLFGKAMLSANDTGIWQQSPPHKNAFENIDFMEAEDSFEEAISIALKIRHNLETENKTTAFITADRNLARLVANNLSRWNIDVDDSSGVPLHLTPNGIFMRLVANVVGENFSPSALVELFKHPLCYAGEERGEFSRTARQFEKIILREMVGNVGLNDIETFIDEQVKNKFNPSATDEIAPKLKSFIADFRSKITPLLSTDNKTFRHMITAHIEVCENLCNTDILWGGNDGNTLHKTISHILENCTEYEPQNIDDYVNSFTGLIMGETVRKTVGLHPRVYIWGLLEGRLQTIDAVIIGGMLEGIMPSEASPNPILSNAMNDKVGLPNSDNYVGLTAHDLISCCGANEITFTRAKIESGRQTIPSRWWLRFEAVAKASGFEKLPQGETDYIALSKSIDRAGNNNIQISAPKPTPPLSARPKHLSVTNITTWYNDPYQTYAKYILGLYKQGDLKVEPTPNINGNIIHTILESFYNKYGTDLPDDMQKILSDMAYTEYGKYSNIIEAQSIWLPRFISCLGELVDGIKNANQTTEKYEVEVKKTTAIKTENSNEFSYSGIADRIDYLSPTCANIIDYKTGTLPSKKSVQDGTESQLGLIGYSMEQNGIKVSELNYWGITNKFKQQLNIDDKNKNITKIAYEKLCKQVDLYAIATTPYYNEKIKPGYNDYEHLFRQDEWGVRASVEEAGDNE